jgi:penicillin-insensitive murein endopeptidase
MVLLTLWKRRVLPALVVGGAVLALVSRVRSRAGRISAPPRLPAPKGAVAQAPARVTLALVEVRPAPDPLEGISEPELARLAETKPSSLGSLYFGHTSRGYLFNGVELDSSPGLRVMAIPEKAWGTANTVGALREAVAEFHRVRPDAPDVAIGDLSKRRGGAFRPHLSHQLGVDVDVGYFYRNGADWYTRATKDNLDADLTWALVKSLLSQGTVEYIFMDRSLQALLRQRALELGDDPAWLDSLFENKAFPAAPIQHASGHLSHFHVRFLDPTAEHVGRALEAHLAPRRRARH